MKSYTLRSDIFTLNFNVTLLQVQSELFRRYAAREHSSCLGAGRGVWFHEETVSGERQGERRGGRAAALLQVRVILASMCIQCKKVA